MHVAILGNGITGATAAIRLRELRPDWRITMISGESTHPYSRPALMFVYMGHMRYADTKPWPDGFWPKNAIALVRDWVVGIETERRVLHLRKRGELGYDALLVATGSQPNRFGWPGQDLEGVQGLYDLMDLKRLYDASPRIRRGVIVGGGLIGIELGEMLASRGIDVTFLVRESSYWSNVLPPEESAMVNREIERHGFDLRLSTELAEIADDGSGRACAALTKDGDRIDCELVGLTAGVHPNLDVVRTAEAIETGRGVLVDDALRTSAEGVWAAGDCAEIRRPEGERNLQQQVWYTGRTQGRVAAESIAGHDVSYDPGVWFNSAKFLDVEYQTYGKVNLGLEGEESLYYEHPDGIRSIRIVHVGGKVVGFNTMGVRFRHRTCERWIAEEREVEHVLDHLAEANFDGEFTRRFERDAARAWRSGGKQGAAR